MKLYLIYHTFSTIETMFTKQKKTGVHSVWLDRTELETYLKLLKKIEYKMPGHSTYRIKTIEAKMAKPRYYSGNQLLEVSIDGKSHQIRTMQGTELKAPAPDATMYRSQWNSPKTKTITIVEFEQMQWD